MKEFNKEPPFTKLLILFNEEPHDRLLTFLVAFINHQQGKRGNGDRQRLKVNLIEWESGQGAALNPLTDRGQVINQGKKLSANSLAITHKLISSRLGIFSLIWYKQA